MSRPSALRAATALALTVTLVAACGGGSDGGAGAPTASSSAISADVANVQAAFKRLVETWNARDADTMLTLWTDAGLASSFSDGDATPAEIEARVREFIGAPELGSVQYLDTSTEGDAAKLDVQFTFGVAYTRSIFTYVRRDGEWLINNEEGNLDIRVPAGAARLDVILNEFAFEFDADALTEPNGVVAITARNIGAQDHEMGVVRVDAGVDLTQALQSAPVDGADPEGLTFIGGGFVGSLDVIVFGFSQFTPGRYALVCMLPDTSEGPDGTPHALKGMVSEFTID